MLTLSLIKEINLAISVSAIIFTSFSSIELMNYLKTNW